MFWEKHRSKIWNLGQHPYRHSLAEFAYSNPAIPGASNIELALNYILAVLYPNSKAAVATQADLPTGINIPNPGDVVPSINDYRVVLDNGNGKQAAYRWEQREGEVSPSWHKVADMDWSNNSIVAQLLDVTQPLYLYKAGLTDIDATGLPITGLYAGQKVYGGDAINQNLTLNANSGDGTGPQTGYVQSDGNFRPTLDNIYDLSTLTERWKDLYLSNSAVVGTTTIGAALITDSTGQISFGNENLITSGNVNASIITGTQLIADDTINNMAIAPGSILDSTGTISFGAVDLTTTGTLRGTAAILLGSGQTLTSTPFVAGPSRSEIVSSTGALSFGSNSITTTGSASVGALTATQLDVNNLRLSANTILSTNLNGDIILSPNGTGSISLLKTLSALDAGFVGTVGITGLLNVDNLSLNGNTLSTTNANGDLFLTPNGLGNTVIGSLFVPSVDAGLDIGSTTNRFRNIYLSGGIHDGTNSINMSDIMGLRSNLYRDVARTIPAQTGDSLFFDSVNGVWLASVPDSEITHNTISGLTTGDAGHTQFVMLAGRSGGQTIFGGSGISENLVLESTSNATKGLISFSDNIVPTTSASFSGGWQGIDLGGPLNLIRDVHSRGEFKGLRFENVLSTALPTFSGQTPGRLYYATDINKAYIDTGAALKVLGVAKFSLDQVFDGIITQLDVNVSSEITDARLSQWQLLDNANNFEIMGVTIQITSASNVRIITNAPLPAGSYRLTGIE